MDAETIDILAALDPDAQIPNLSVARQMHANSPLYHESEQQFINRYCNVSFGWYIAEQFARAKRGFPIPMLGRDTWVYRAFLMIVDSWTHYDRNVAEAFHLAHRVKGCPEMGAKLKALILSTVADDPVSHLQTVARRTGLPYDTVEAFETLFYNVLDRREDGLYLSQSIYPLSRLVELAEDYMRDSSVESLMTRAGYNHKELDLSAYLAGIGDKTYMAKISASENREAELSTLFMGNGLVLAKANLLNQRSVGLSRVTTLVAASRQAGGVDEQPALAGVATGFLEQFKIAASCSQEETAQMLREDAGLTIGL